MNRQRRRRVNAESELNFDKSSERSAVFVEEKDGKVEFM
jgi:hypothetical protein